jgi:tRNA 2-selenouridine synthase
MFETRIAAELAKLDPTKITFVEAESSKIGNRVIPPSLWALMVDAPRIHITAPLMARSAFLCRAYADLTQDSEALSELLDKLRPYHSGAQLSQWHAKVQSADWQTLAEGLIAVHYDPRYAKSAAHKGDAIHKIDLTDLDDGTLAKTAENLHTLFS